MQSLLRTDSGANQMPRTLEIAIRQATGNRGVSVVVIPGDVAFQHAMDAPEPQRRPVAQPRGLDNVSSRYRRLATILNGDGRVTMLCGSGCPGAHDQVSRWPIV